MITDYIPKTIYSVPAVMKDKDSKSETKDETHRDAVATPSSDSVLIPVSLENSLKKIGASDSQTEDVPATSDDVCNKLSETATTTSPRSSLSADETKEETETNTISVQTSLRMFQPNIPPQPSHVPSYSKISNKAEGEGEEKDCPVSPTSSGDLSEWDLCDPK